jgi:ubiquinone biosynthesis protein
MGQKMNATSFIFIAAVVVLTGSVLLVGLAVGARRLLGLQPGVVRTVLAGLLGLRSRHRTTATAPIHANHRAAGDRAAGRDGFLVLAEAVVPSGSVRPLTWARALRHRLARARRYLQISQIAARHGLLPYLRGRRRLQADNPAGRAALARSVRLALEEGGVSFVKLGQLLATRRDLLPAEFVDELGRLHHQVTPAPWPQAEQVLGQELGTPEAMFDELDARPLAAASIAQVHQARLRPV